MMNPGITVRLRSWIKRKNRFFQRRNPCACRRERHVVRHFSHRIFFIVDSSSPGVSDLYDDDDVGHGSGHDGSS